MNQTMQERNKALVLDAFDTLFNKRDYAAAEKYWSFSGHGPPVAWIAADIVRIENGRLAEHWDVIEDEARRESSKSGLPMFGDHFTG